MKREIYEQPVAEIIIPGKTESVETAITASCDGNSILAAWLRGEVE